MKKITNIFLFLLSISLLASCSNQTQETSVLESQSIIYETTASASETTTEILTSAVQTQAQTTTTVQTLPPTTQEESTSVQASQTQLQTTAVTTETVSETTTETVKSQNICTVTIDLSTIKNNTSSLKKGKEGFVTSSGYILQSVEAEFENGETVFDVLKRVCKQNVCSDNCQYCQSGGIQLEYSFTPAYNSYYVEGIHQIYEKDCGTMSGWMYSVNGVFPDCSASDYEVQSGDVICFVFTCDGGSDIGNEY